MKKSYLLLFFGIALAGCSKTGDPTPSPATTSKTALTLKLSGSNFLAQDDTAVPTGVVVAFVALTAYDASPNGDPSKRLYRASMSRAETLAGQKSFAVGDFAHGTHLFVSVRSSLLNKVRTGTARAGSAEAIADNKSLGAAGVYDGNPEDTAEIIIP